MLCKSVCIALQENSMGLVVNLVLLQVAPLPKDLLDRRVEITGPVDRKMVINAVRLQMAAILFVRLVTCAGRPLGSDVCIIPAAQLWQQRVHGRL